MPLTLRPIYQDNQHVCSNSLACSDSIHCSDFGVHLVGVTAGTLTLGNPISGLYCSSTLACSNSRACSGIAVNLSVLVPI